MPLREEEIRPEHLKGEQTGYLEADIRRLLARSSDFVSVPCPACGSDEGRVAFTKWTLTYVACAACGTVYVSPRPTPDILAYYYRTSENYQYWNTHIFPSSEQARREKIFAPRARRVADICRRYDVRQSSLLEVGAGFGTFCEEIRRLGIFQDVIAVEPTPDLAETCRRKGLHVIELPIEQAPLDDDAVDVIVSFEVIEHLFSPLQFVQACHKVLAPNGLLVLTCPNVKGFDLSLLGSASDTFDVEHLNYFHPASLSALAFRCGFDVLEVSTPGELDAELARKKVILGEVDLSSQPFLARVLIDEWDRLGPPFQQFLAANGLSSHMWLVARKMPLSA